MLYNPLHNSYRRFCSKWWRHWFSPFTYTRAVKTFWQRGTRGWADCDVWGVDSYVCDVLIPMLERLKRVKHGVPVPPDAVMDECGQATDAEYARWTREWDARLDEMIAGFRAAQAIMDGPLDQFFTKDDTQPFGLSYDADGARKWTDEQEAIRAKGFATFTEYFFALWD